MVSDKELIAVADLEKFAIIDYSAINASLTDAVVESKISDAEIFVCGVVGRNYTSTDVPDEIKFAVKTVSKKMMENYLIDMGFDVDERMTYSDQYIDDNLSILLEPFIRTETNVRRLWIR